ncbi:DUF4123 domain-containing protein [Vibrio mangrovi]|uniref:DUF4123 domain-containing protein n=1 Tax=Vibrio mangrovi TaxID=474394 RepID=A0A1Y6IQQ6_9VIBR|nr:DUF4123 domain-containing protein [Vibrio mangrovi]MDW6004072.1 DUF4123 domain-containing protein [Vibrio mangrovi]SMR99130.1 hypothetical protein VIM7927_00352 [Vibrio mangrovi]
MSAFQTEQAIPDMTPEDSRCCLYLFVDGRQVAPYSRSNFPDDDIVESDAVYLHESDEEPSPYLLAADCSIRQWFLAQQEGCGGFFFTSFWSIRKLREHFRQLIQVQSPYGTGSYLNMAHPEVAWTLLSSSCCWFWRPIEKAWLPTHSGWKILSRFDAEPMIEVPLPLQLTPWQWQRLDHIAWRNLLKVVYHHVQHHFPEILFQQERGDLWIEAHAQIARQKGFITPHDQLNYFNIIGLLGETAVTGEQYPEIYRLLHFPSPVLKTPGQRVRHAARLAEQYVQRD